MELFWTGSIFFSSTEREGQIPFSLKRNTFVLNDLRSPFDKVARRGLLQFFLCTELHFDPLFSLKEKIIYAFVLKRFYCSKAHQCDCFRPFASVPSHVAIPHLQPISYRCLFPWPVPRCPLYSSLFSKILCPPFQLQ